MSVYTKITRLELVTFLSHYALGQLLDYQGITDGIENTNYFVTTTTGEYVLTLFEELGMEELPYFLNLMAFLAEHEVPSAHPLADHQQQYLRTLNGKPAALVQRLQGCSQMQPQITHCQAIGEALGRLHAVSHAFTDHRNSRRGQDWWCATSHRLMPCLPAEDHALLTTELAFQLNHSPQNLPQGITHSDLFRDNVLFVDTHLSGIIDFYFACNDVFLYDVAITINDWCSDDDGYLIPDKTLAFLQAYHQQRPFTAAEYQAWPIILRSAALRFWLSRLQDLYFPYAGEMTHTKDPNFFKRILLNHIRHPATLTHGPSH